jgi:hypothetical protein
MNEDTIQIVYAFICDPKECDTLIEVHCSKWDFPSGQVKMTCPCGRDMQWIEYRHGV